MELLESHHGQMRWRRGVAGDENSGESEGTSDGAHDVARSGVSCRRCQSGASAPEKGDDRAGWEGVAEGLVAPQYGKGAVLGRCIDDDERLGAVVGVPEGHALDPGDA